MWNGREDFFLLPFFFHPFANPQETASFSLWHGGEGENLRKIEEKEFLQINEQSEKFCGGGYKNFVRDCNRGDKALEKVKNEVREEEMEVRAGWGR